MVPLPFLIFNQSNCLIQVVDTNSYTEWQTVQIQISWLLQKPTDLDLHCLQRQGISGLSRTRVSIAKDMDIHRTVFIFPKGAGHFVISCLLFCKGCF